MDKAGVHARMPGSGLVVPTPTGQHGQGRGRYGPPPGRGRGVGHGYGTAAVVIAGGRAGQSPGAGPPPTYEQVVLADAPVVFLQLDETSGSTAYDSSGNGYNGTYALGGGSSMGDPPLITVGYSIYIALGSSGRVEVASESAFNANGQLTIELWIKTDNTAGSNYIVGADNGTQRYFQFRTDATGAKLEIILFDTGGGTHSLDGLVTVTDNAAHHVVCTYDGATIALYVDGSLDNSVAATFTLATSNPGLALAERYVGVGGGGVYGYYDEFAFYTKALSAARVAAHYQAGTT